MCATYVLKRDARYWWETVKMRIIVQDMTWDESETESSKLAKNQKGQTKQGYEMKPNSQVQRTNQYRNNNNKRKGNFGGQKNGNGSGSQSKKPNITYPTCKKCGKNHPGECRSGTNACFICGKEGHFAKNCFAKVDQGDKLNQPGVQGSGLNAAQVKMEGASITQSRLEAPEANARIFTFSRNDAEAGTSNVVTGQLSVAKMSAYVLFDFGATYSFISNSFADQLNWVRDRMNQSFHVALPSGEVLLSNYWARHVPIVFSGRELHADLVLIKMYDYDVILGMDFLGKYNALIECRRRRVIFHPYEEQKFEFVGESRKQPKVVISSMRAKKLLASGCMGYLATVVNKSVETKGNVEDVPIVRDFVDVFPEELPGLPPD
ncbi:hypothetical protein UlMin_043252 [Ulmus minor]